MGRKPRLLIWDLEVSKTQFLIRNYGRKMYSKYLSSKDIVQERVILCAAWKYLDENKITVIANDPNDVFNDEKIIRKLHEHIVNADVLIAHNGDNFDIKEYNGRALKYGLPPTDRKTIKSVDTLKMARKYFRLDSNELSYLANYLSLPQKKLRAPDWDLIHDGDKKEINYMIKYNKIDVVVLEEVYKKLRGWDQRHPDIGIIANIRDTNNEPVPVCKTCLSYNTVKDGYAKNKQETKRKKRFLCNACGKRSVYGEWEATTKGE